ncbi:MAG: glutamate formimidoyltransferase [Candidatus Marinimicrobia bacterium]|nr:glutamate formimidoyltransferase [Candidatus Neomarinimicrobiota bacterium]
MKIIECVPNFSEGIDLAKIKEITNEIESVNNISLLDVDPGADTNRTVVTFVGPPENVVEAAFLSIKKASEILDMQSHKGEHARMGATDVCPLVPVNGVTMDECVDLSKLLAERVGRELHIPIYLYENSASNLERVNLANIRSGEYEGMCEKLQVHKWKPDFGPTKLHKTAGVTAIGAREFLIAYNINLNSHEKKLASDIALDIREAGRAKRNSEGKFEREADGTIVKIPGSLKSTKAVGWYIDEYKQAQVSMNLTNFNVTSPHQAFDEVCMQAHKRGLRVTGSELVGLIPLSALLNAGLHYLHKQGQSQGIPENDIIHIAIKSLGLDDLGEFNPKEKIIEFRVAEKYGALANSSITDFIDELSSNSPAPGGGSVSALAGALAAGLSAMVGNLTIGKKGFEDSETEMNNLAINSQKLKDQLIKLIDDDTNSFNGVIDAIRMPKKTDREIEIRHIAIQEATKIATYSPLSILEACASVMPLAKLTASKGNPNSISDAGVAAEMAHAGAQGGAMNVLINLSDIDDDKFCNEMKIKVENILLTVNEHLMEIRKIVIAAIL